ncbi:MULTISPECIES: hypothetical protein [unclassified Mesorhizobium]|uniref:hypothetical protein n=1 Tax=unclassified Mesorhizobium TaxID=325217 RepID=UPI00109219F1|nr:MULTISPECIES: hypothetical protein [unclassified Mesorhizobium]TGP89843.1 hypothetical protein EN861_23830 [Mesorhizobium sp. M8A.F.Ca.ET.218.01.1.1]TGT16335.1 hypothetical protein EN856_23365 [Mesorhizobium sp. M8A.F.Ca.ET.213.01.1.1]TIS94814.1 MAG: hypothetical protein E5W88_14120 [Mesorhizobium sp.]
MQERFAQNRDSRPDAIDIRGEAGLLCAIQQRGQQQMKKYEKPTWQKRERLSAVTALAGPSNLPPPQ